MAKARRIHFNDGTSLTLSQAARLIRKEKRLCKGCYIKLNSGIRCVYGVLEGYKYTNAQLISTRQLTKNSEVELDAWLDSSLFLLNDTFRGTDEDRAKYLAEQFEAAAKS